QQLSSPEYDVLIHGIHLVPMKAKRAGSSLFRASSLGIGLPR
ncbi:hypothetical protein ADUPG1_005486, partial [Aduncisulcus paluster]